MFELVGLGAIAIVMVIISFLAALLILKGNYIKVSPNKVAVISGKQRQLADGKIVGYRLVTGGATLVTPFLEKVEYLDLNLTAISLSVEKAYTIDDIPISLKAIANTKIKGDDSSIRSAAERFLGIPKDEFHKILSSTIEEDFRKILTKVSFEEIDKTHSPISQNLLTEVENKLGKMGISIESSKIEEISDERV